MPRVALTTLGCKVNQVETQSMELLFRKAQYTIVDFADIADVYIINTCSVTHLGERKSRQLIRRAHRNNPEAVVAVTGCYAQIAAEEISKIAGVQVVIGTQDRSKIVDLVEEAFQHQIPIKRVNNIMHTHDFEEMPISDTSNRTRAFLKIQDGCSQFCSYCIIPFTRGPIRSRSLDSIKEATAKLVDASFHEIVLTGIHIGLYGKDFKDSTIELADAVEACLENPKLRRLRLGSLESIELSDRLLQIMKTDSRCMHHFHIPLQAGTDEILKQMNRHYTTEDFCKIVEKIRREIPDAAISTDIIVGFPGETDELFEQSLEFAKSIGFSKMHIFPYSKRQGTRAANMDNQVDEQVKKQRVQQMQDMSLLSAMKFNKSFIGKELEVLLEQEIDDFWEGLSTNYIRVFISKNQEEILPLHSGEIVKVQIIDTYEDGVRGIVMLS